MLVRHSRIDRPSYDGNELGLAVRTSLLENLRQLNSQSIQAFPVYRRDTLKTVTLI
jgi:hypothetical protein